jgi:hypothetical protein
MTLDDFNEKIVRPMVLAKVADGSLDVAIQDEECWSIIDSDPELRDAVVKRLLQNC